jgi:hypothetical protein
LDLTGGESSQADVVAVVHVVLDVVSTAARACVGGGSRATLGRLALSGSIIDVVSRAGAAALESMIQAYPVANL